MFGSGKVKRNVVEGKYAITQDVELFAANQDISLDREAYPAWLMSIRRSRMA